MGIHKSKKPDDFDDFDLFSLEDDPAKADDDFALRDNDSDDDDDEDSGEDSGLDSRLATIKPEPSKHIAPKSPIISNPGTDLPTGEAPAKPQPLIPEPLLLWGSVERQWEQLHLALPGSPTGQAVHAALLRATAIAETRTLGLAIDQPHLIRADRHSARQRYDSSEATDTALILLEALTQLYPANQPFDARSRFENVLRRLWQRLEPITSRKPMTLFKLAPGPFEALMHHIKPVLQGQTNLIEALVAVRQVWRAEQLFGDWAGLMARVLAPALLSAADRRCALGFLNCHSAYELESAAHANSPQVFIGVCLKTFATTLTNLAALKTQLDTNRHLNLQKLAIRRSTARITQALDYIHLKPSISASEIEAVAGVTSSGADMMINSLLRTGIIHQRGIWQKQRIYESRALMEIYDGYGAHRLQEKYLSQSGVDQE